MKSLWMKMIWPRLSLVDGNESKLHVCWVCGVTYNQIYKTQVFFYYFILLDLLIISWENVWETPCTEESHKPSLHGLICGLEAFVCECNFIFYRSYLVIVGSLKRNLSIVVLYCVMWIKWTQFWRFLPFALFLQHWPPLLCSSSIDHKTDEQNYAKDWQSDLKFYFYFKLMFSCCK